MNNVTKGHELLKTRMTFDEMSEVYSMNFSYFTPNRSNVGRFAKTLGYKLTKQMVDRKVYLFYINEQV